VSPRSSRLTDSAQAKKVSLSQSSHTATCFSFHIHFHIHQRQYTPPFPSPLCFFQPMMREQPDVTHTESVGRRRSPTGRGRPSTLPTCIPHPRVGGRCCALMCTIRTSQIISLSSSNSGQVVASSRGKIQNRSTHLLQVVVVVRLGPNPLSSTPYMWICLQKNKKTTQVPDRRSVSSPPSRPSTSMGFYYGPSEQDLQAAEDFLEHQRDEWERRRFDWSAELEDPDWRVRVDALVELSQLEPEDIETHADAILSCLNDSNANVRVRACETLRSLDLNPEIFMRYVCDVVAKIGDLDDAVDEIAEKTLEELEPEMIAEHVQSVLHVLSPIDDLGAIDDPATRLAALLVLRKLEPTMLAQHADAVVARLDDPDREVREKAFGTLSYLELEALAQHAHALIARLDHPDQNVRHGALWTLKRLEPATLAQYADPVAARLEDSDANVRHVAVQLLMTLDSATLLQHADAVAERLNDPSPDVRHVAVQLLMKLDSATLSQHADAVAERLNDLSPHMRLVALDALGKLEPAALARFADAVHALLEDVENFDIRDAAVVTLGKLERAVLSQYAGAVSARLEDSEEAVRLSAVLTLGKLDPVTLVQHAPAVLSRWLEDTTRVRNAARATLHKLPRFVIHDLDLESGGDVRTRFVIHYLDSAKSGDVHTRLLGRLGWYRYRLRWRVQRLALYWYALPYRPNGPGHARDVEAWGRMVGNQGQGRAATSAKRHKAERDTAREATDENRRQTRHTKRKK